MNKEERDLFIKKFQKQFEEKMEQVHKKYRWHILIGSFIIGILLIIEGLTKIITYFQAQ